MLPNTQNFKNVPQQYFVLALFGVLNFQELQFQKKKRKVKQYFFQCFFSLILLCKNCFNKSGSDLMVFSSCLQVKLMILVFIYFC